MSACATPTRTLTSRGRMAFLVVLVALIFAGPVRAQPPDLLTKDAAALAAFTVADGFVPGHAGLKALSTLHAGAERGFAAWNLEGVFSDPEGRRLVGGSSMFLGGFNGSPLGGGFAATQLEMALAVAGEQRDCWLLRDTDHVWPVDFLHKAWNGKGFNVGNKDSQTVEAGAYAKVLEMAFYTSQKAFDNAADKKILYANLDQEPEEYQGKVVPVRGRLKGLRLWKPPMAASAAGVNDLYEGYIRSDLGPYTYCVVFPVLPSGLQVGEKLDVPVTTAGYFFKKWRYQNEEGGKPKARYAALVIAHTLELNPPRAAPAQEQAGLDVLLPVFIGVVALSIGLLVGLAYWFRRTDERLRKRLLRTLEQGKFVPPPPEAVPMAQPVARPKAEPGETGKR